MHYSLSVYHYLSLIPSIASCIDYSLSLLLPLNLCIASLSNKLCTLQSRVAEKSVHDFRHLISSGKFDVLCQKYIHCCIANIMADYTSSGHTDTEEMRNYPVVYVGPQSLLCNCYTFFYWYCCTHCARKLLTSPQFRTHVEAENFSSIPNRSMILWYMQSWTSASHSDQSQL